MSEYAERKERKKGAFLLPALGSNASRAGLTYAIIAALNPARFLPGWRLYALILGSVAATGGLSVALYRASRHPADRAVVAKPISSPAVQRAFERIDRRWAEDSLLPYEDGGPIPAGEAAPRPGVKPRLKTLTLDSGARDRRADTHPVMLTRVAETAPKSEAATETAGAGEPDAEGGTREGARHSPAPEAVEAGLAREAAPGAARAQAPAPDIPSPPPSPADAPAPGGAGAGARAIRLARAAPPASPRGRSEAAQNVAPLKGLPETGPGHYVRPDPSGNPQEIPDSEVGGPIGPGSPYGDRAAYEEAALGAHPGDGVCVWGNESVGGTSTGPGGSGPSGGAE